MNYILTTCGLSILTNGLRGYFDLKDIYSNSNLLEDEIDKELLEKFENEIDKIKKKIGTLNNDESKKLSAELNALLRYYNNNLDKSDFYKLLHTDTYLGRKVAEIIEYYLISKGLKNVSTYTTKDLKTSNIEEFQFALSDLVKDLSEELDGYKSSKYKIIFNLTGGFKGINSFLQTMASLYADESIYIFETGDELLIIPRIPIKIDEEIFKENIDIFRALDIGISVAEKKLSLIHRTLINKIDNDYTLSPWGEIVWQKFKIEYYKKNLLNSISGKIEFSENFKNNFNSLNENEKYQLNKSVDKLENYLINKFNLKSLNYHALKGNISERYSHEFYPFDGNDSRRCYCNELNNKIVLEKIDSHLK